MFNPNYMQNMPRNYQPMYQPNYNPTYTPMYQQQGIQGRIVDNIDSAKVTEISLDGSVNFFPLADGSAIVTKQLQIDGTSKIVVYKPVVNETPKQIDLNAEITSLKEQVEELKNKLMKIEGVDADESKTDGNANTKQKCESNAKKSN